MKEQSSRRSLDVIIGRTALTFFGDLASLLDVFGNISKNEIHPRNTI